jgi:hypothetical protein
LSRAFLPGHRQASAAPGFRASGIKYLAGRRGIGWGFLPGRPGKSCRERQGPFAPVIGPAPTDIGCGAAAAAAQLRCSLQALRALSLKQKDAGTRRSDEIHKQIYREELNNAQDEET